MHSSSTPVPRRFRLRLLDMRLCKCEVPAFRCFAWPLAVNRNRFLVPLCVFILGMAELSLIQIHHPERVFLPGETGHCKNASAAREGHLPLLSRPFSRGKARAGGSLRSLQDEPPANHLTAVKQKTPPCSDVTISLPSAKAGDFERMPPHSYSNFFSPDSVSNT